MSVAPGAPECSRTDEVRRLTNSAIAEAVSGSFLRRSLAFIVYRVGEIYIFASGHSFTGRTHWLPSIDPKDNPCTGPGLE